MANQLTVCRLIWHSSRLEMLRPIEVMTEWAAKRKTFHPGVSISSQSVNKARIVVLHHPRKTKKTGTISRRPISSWHEQSCRATPSKTVTLTVSMCHTVMPTERRVKSTRPIMHLAWSASETTPTMAVMATKGVRVSTRSLAFKRGTLEMTWPLEFVAITL